MKKWISGLLVLVMLVGMMAVPASAGGPSKVTYLDEKRLYPMSEAPEMDYTRTIGPVTFSNVASVTEQDRTDAYGKPIHVYFVTLGVGGCMRADVDAEFFYLTSESNYSYVHTEIKEIIGANQNPVFTDDHNQMKTNTAAWRKVNGGFILLKRSNDYINAFAGSRKADGSWPAGLTWQFDWHEEELRDSTLYWKIYEMQVKAGNEMWYYMVSVEDDISSFTGNRPDGSYAPIIDVNAPASATAYPSKHTVYFFGQTSKAPIYGINGDIYLKLRDIASLSGKATWPFNVNWNDSLNGPIRIETGKSYVPTGKELTGAAKQQGATLISPDIYLDGVPTPLTVYNVGGEAYFRLLDVLHVVNYAWRLDEAYDSFYVYNGTYHNGYVNPIQEVKQAVPMKPAIYVGGKKVNFEAYTIDGICYVKVRDLAQSVNGTAHQFNVEYDPNSGIIDMNGQDIWGVETLRPGDPYEPVGGELTPGDGKTKQATPVKYNQFYKASSQFDRTQAYDIDGERYFPLQDLARNMNVGLFWDSKREAVLIDGDSSYDVVKVLEFQKAQSGVKAQPAAKPEPQPQPEPAPAPSEERFSDVKNGDWFYSFVEKVCEAGWMTGKGDGVFDPKGNLSLAEVMVLASRLHADHSGKEISAVEGAWYMPYYTYCVSNGILGSEELGVEDLSRAATRYEMVSLLDRAAEKSKTAGGLNTVSDGFIPDLAEQDELGEVVYRWYRAGILTGDTQHKFNGPNNITRAEVSVILCQLLGLVERAKL